MSLLLVSEVGLDKLEKSVTTFGIRIGVGQVGEKCHYFWYQKLGWTSCRKVSLLLVSELGLDKL